jgi:DNA invertase Pin-like site-specific DNA recombinase
MVQREMYSYRRCSRRKQRKGSTVSRQDRRALDLAAKLGCHLNESLRLDDWGVAAFKGQNVEVGRLGAFIRAMESRQIPRGSILAIEQLDRLSRQDALKAIKLFIQILDGGVSIATFLPERLYEPETTDGAALQEVLGILIRAHEESVRKSDLGRAAWVWRRELATSEGRIAMASGPAWLRMRPDRSGWEAIEERVEAVKLLVRLGLEGRGSTATVTELRRRNVTAFGRSGRWSSYYIRHIWENPALIGAWQPRARADGRWVATGDLVRGYYPRVIEDAEWDLLRSRVTQRRTQRGRRDGPQVNVFGELVWDAARRCKLTVTTSRPLDGPLYRYLAPALKGYGDQAGPRSRFRFDVFERGVLKALRELTVADLLGDQRGDAVQQRLAEKSAALRSTKQARDELKARARVAGPSIGSVLDRLDQVEGDLQRLQQEVTLLQEQLNSGSPLGLGVLQSSAEALENASEEQRVELRWQIRAMLPDLVESIWVLVEAAGSARLAHVQICFHAGTTRYAPILHDPYGVNPSFTRLDGVDLRKWGQET